MERADLEAAVRLSYSRPFSEISRVVQGEGWLLAQEKYDGAHLFDNSDPANPKPLGFIQIPGCLDLTFEKGFFYADNGVDLIEFGIENNEVVVTRRFREVFDPIAPPDNLPIPAEFFPENRPDGIIVKWQVR